MTAERDMTTRFLTVLMLLLLLVVLPVRVMSADPAIATCIALNTAGTDSIPPNNTSIDFISEKVCLPAFTTENRPGSFPENVFRFGGFNVRSCTLDSLFQQFGQINETNTSSLETISDGIGPLAEISYSLTSRIAFEIRGHVNIYTEKTPRSPADDHQHLGYTLFFGPSYSAGTHDDSTRLYTQFGIGYNIIDSGTDLFFKDCPASFGTGFSFGFRGKTSNIRIGYNYSAGFSDTISYTTWYEKTDPCSAFLFVTCRFDI